MVTLAVGLLAGLGAAARYLVDQAIRVRRPGDFPAGILVVNVSGSVLLGLVTGLGSHGRLTGSVVTALSAGFCGGFTTWSTFATDTAALAERDRPRAAVLNVIASVALGLLAAAAGFGIALLAR
jgi:CrcB protein